MSLRTRTPHLILRPCQLPPLLLAAAACACGPAVRSGGAASAAVEQRSDPAPEGPAAPVARVNGRVLLGADLEAHRLATGLDRAAALEDLIDLELLRQVAVERQMRLPPEPWDPEVRALVEGWLAEDLGVEPRPGGVQLVVDHAWARDAASPEERAEQRRQIERIRLMALSGTPIAQAWESLDLDGRIWHVGVRETYPAEVIPQGARELPPGTVSRILPGDGGLHLFRILERLSTDGVDLRRRALAERLRSAATIER